MCVYVYVYMLVFVSCPYVYICMRIYIHKYVEWRQQNAPSPRAQPPTVIQIFMGHAYVYIYTSIYINPYTYIYTHHA